MNSKQIRSTAIATGAASLLFLGSGVAAQAAPACPGTDPTDPYEADQAAAAEKCDGLTGQEAFDKKADDLPDADDGHYTWTADSGMADTEHYDPCDGLSAITVSYATDEGMPAGSPGYSIVMLFHDGEYLGTDTAEAYEWTPEIERVDEDTLDVEYPYGHRDDAVGPEGTTESTFTWDEESDSVEHSGEFPDTF